MQLKRENCAEYNNGPGVALMDLHKLLVPRITTEHDQEEDAEEEVTQEFNEHSERRTVKHKRHNTVSN